MIKRRKGVSPVIAVLLLIAIAVATGILVYVWVTGLAGTLQQTGGQQVAEQLELLAYDFTDTSTPKLVLYLKNPGGITVTIDKVYVGQTGGTIVEVSKSLTLAPGASNSLTISGTDFGTLSVSSGTSYTVKIVTTTGAVFTYTVIAGRSG